MDGTKLTASSAIDGFRPNPDWAALPIFSREGWRRMSFGAFAESVNVRVEPADAAEEVKERHEQGFLTSLQFLKEMLELAKEVVEAEKHVDPVEERDRAKEALTELFKEAKGKNTHIIVERIVADIDDIVKKVRFPDWQHTTQGERLVQKELRRTLLKYKLHTDQELFDKAYGYIRQYY